MVKRHKEELGLLSLDAMWWHGKNSRPTHRSEVWGVNNSATTPPCVVSSTQTSKWTNHWQLTILYFFLFKTEIDEKKKTGYCTCTSTKIVFRVFFNLNIEEGNNSTYQELLAYHFVLVAAIVTELRRRWHFDSLSMISASPAGAITRNSFNPYLKGNHNFRWSLRTLTKGSTLIMSVIMPKVWLGCVQNCALVGPDGLWHLTFALRKLGRQIIHEVPWISEHWVP